MAAPGLSLVVVYCDDPGACRDFYAGLGLTFVRERHGSGPEHWAAVLAGGTVLELYPATPDRRTGAVRLGFTVKAAEEGLVPGRHILRDPDGRTVDVNCE